MLISIIIPIYNVERYVKECLESVFRQTYPYIEVILVNDCTPDASMEIAKNIVCKYKDKYPTIIINHELNKGLSESRNSGIRVAKGEYIYFIDSDDVIMPDAIKLLADIAIKHKGIDWIEGKHVTGLDYSSVSTSEDCKKEIIYRGDNGVKHCFRSSFVWNILIRRELISKYHLYFYKDITFAEDIPYRFLIAKHLSCVAMVPYVTYFYRINEFSLTHAIKQSHFENMLQVLCVLNDNLYLNKYIRKCQIERFCITSFHFWNKRWRQTNFHRSYFDQYASFIKHFVKGSFKDMSLYNLLLLSPFYFPYPIAICLSKLVWRIRSIIG